MKKAILAAVAAGILLGAPALAIDAAKSSKAMNATMLCRPSLTTEKPMAMMGDKGMVCKSMAKMMVNGHMGPDTKGMDAAATNAAWERWLQQSMLIQSYVGGGTGGG